MTSPNPKPRPASAGVLPGVLVGPALEGALKENAEIVFVTRTPHSDPHWYANIGYWSEDETKPMYNTTDGSRLCKLDLRTKLVTVLLEDRTGSLRDPSVHYDGTKILFSYRKGGTQHFNLFEIKTDGSGLRQVTSGPWDDIESTYLPNGDIVFISTRCKRWVSCWYTQVAIMHRCDADGKNVRAISGNIEHDNTPAVLPDGRLLYTRWEYVDRSQVDFHALWTSNPDGTNVQTYYGNMHPGTVMIDAKPVPGTTKIAAIFSPGHGRTEHVGGLTVVTPDAGPDHRGSAVPVKGLAANVRDPYVIHESLFIVARKNDVLLVDAAAGQFEVLHTDKQELHEPALIRPRARERIIPDRVDTAKPTGRLVLSDVLNGRYLDGVNPGDVKKLLVLETLPKPVNFSGGPNPLTWLGTFNLERVLGVVPVEADGSAYFEVPAHRSLVLVALDKDDLSLKRMQSFVSVMPGETVGCVGCHEQRTTAPPFKPDLAAMRRPASVIESFAGIPDVIDYPRDVQPVLDEHCVPCHNYERPDGRIVLTGDHGVQFSHSYFTLVATGQVVDGRNAYGNQPPRTIGSSASPLMKLIDGSHYGAKLTPRQWRTVWMWIESGATYSGTYASLGTGMVGGPGMPMYARRCGSCHVTAEQAAANRNKVVLPAPTGLPRRPGGAPHERIINPSEFRRDVNLLFNYTDPEKSVVLLAPLAKEAGGWGVCRPIEGLSGPAALFCDVTDPDYQALLAGIVRVKAHLDSIKRFDMPGFRPNAQYVREMKRFGIIPPDLDPATAAIDVHATDQAYWESLWYRPSKRP